MRTDTTSDLKTLLEENLKISREILKSTQATRRHLKWAQIISTLRLLIIVIPLILALLYLPPFLKNLNEIFSQLYGGEQFNILKQFESGGIDLKKIEGLLKQK